MLQSLNRVGVYSKRFSSDNIRKTFVSTNGVVAAWHPETKVPYEHTKPIDLSKVEAPATPLKSALFQRKPRVPNNSELKDIFYTPKNEWYTKTREARLFSVAPPAPKKKPT